MTGRQKLEANEMKLARCIKNNWCCEVCGKHTHNLQLAHIIPKHKNYIKRFGVGIIHHRLNLVLTCEKCNSSVMLSPDTIQGQEHIEKIRKQIDMED